MSLKSRILKKHRKILGLTGITAVLGSWVLVPLIAQKYYGMTPIDTAFRLTFFWSIVWFLNHLRKKYQGS